MSIPRHNPIPRHATVTSKIWHIAAASFSASLSEAIETIQQWMDRHSQTPLEFLQWVERPPALTIEVKFIPGQSPQSFSEWLNEQGNQIRGALW